MLGTDLAIKARDELTLAEGHLKMIESNVNTLNHRDVLSEGRPPMQELITVSIHFIEYAIDTVESIYRRLDTEEIE